AITHRRPQQIRLPRRPTQRHMIIIPQPSALPGHRHAKNTSLLAVPAVVEVPTAVVVPGAGAPPVAVRAAVVVPTVVARAAVAAPQVALPPAVLPPVLVPRVVVLPVVEVVGPPVVVVVVLELAVPRVVEPARVNRTARVPTGVPDHNHLWPIGPRRGQRPALRSP
ncbi:MAG: hypothetical protein ACRDU4_17170, partial [Mycobacterium sp.]